MAIRASLAIALSFDASIEQDGDLLVCRRRSRRADRVGCPRWVLVAAAGSRSRPVDVGKPEFEIDHLKVVGKLITPGVARKGSED